MKKIKIKISLYYQLLICGILFSNSSFSQISLNGVVDVKEYAGSQPDLIEGISSIPASGRPLIRHVYMVSQNIIGLIIDEKALIPSKLKPYQKQINDTMILAGYNGRIKHLVRNEDTIGFLVGLQNNWYRPFNDIAGEVLDLKWIADPTNYVVSSIDDSKYIKGINPSNIFRKSIPKEEVTRLRPGNTHQSTHRHFIFLELPDDLFPGKHYKISFNNNTSLPTKSIKFLFNDQDLRSEAIHVNLYGYGLHDKKSVFLSSWMGDGGELQYPGNLHFRIVNLENNKTVYEGQVKLKQPAAAPEYILKEKLYNHNKTDVYEMDFSSLTEKGSYKLVVDGIGCSFDFLVDESIWEKTMRLLMKGYLHQRAGIELGPPYTDYIRPRNMHPEDGQIIHKLDPEKYFAARTKMRGQFGAIEASILENTSIPEAWGGWMDAGDFDRRMTHFYSVRRMMYLYEVNPQYFEKLNLKIPESSNNIPDILDEAIWCLDLYRRTQGVYEKGAVSWQVESIAHPLRGETSWLNSLPTALLPPTPEACINYAGTAAQMALLLRKYDKNLAKKFEESALDAMKWVIDYHPNDLGSVVRIDDIESIAYLNLYRLTDNKMWHQRFHERFDKIFPDGIEGHLKLDGVDAAAIYSLMNTQQVDQKLQRDIRKAVITLADELLEGAHEVTYGILRLKSQPLSRLVIMRSKVLPVVIAHKLTLEGKYKDALVTTIQYTMGLNPMNQSYISGLGERSFMPYHNDWHADMLKIPAGIPNFGPAIFPENSWENENLLEPWLDGHIAILRDIGIYPAKLSDWPLPEACFDQVWLTPINEFMVEYPMGELLMLTGYLASYSE